MKVTFEATLDDFVDIAMRSRSPKAGVNYFFNLAFIAIGAGAVSGGFVFWIARVWPPAVIAFVLSAAVILIWNYGWRERALSEAFAKQMHVPTLVTVEITAEGISFDQQFGKQTEKVFRTWDSIAEIEETPDAIYFIKKGSLYSAVRKRGFASESEKDEFLSTARRLMQEYTASKPSNV